MVDQSEMEKTVDQDEIAVAEIMVGEVVSRVALEALESGGTRA